MIDRMRPRLDCRVNGRLALLRRRTQRGDRRDRATTGDLGKTSVGRMRVARFPHPRRFAFGLLVVLLALGAWVSSGRFGPPASSATTAGTPTWSTTGSLSTARLAHTATLLPSGKVLVVGGYGYISRDTYLNSAELFDPTSGT